MSYPFPPELQQLVQESLATGNYQSEDEVLLDAVRLLRQRTADARQFEQTLKTRLERLDRNEGIELEDKEALRTFFDDVQLRGKERRPGPVLARDPGES